LKTLFKGQIPVVCGTTGWLKHKPEMDALCLANDTAFFYASNYSIGVNIFFKLNEYLARVMQKYPEYQVKIEEIHHTEKKDAPSGTAITLAEGIIKNYPSLKNWINEESQNKADLSIISRREPQVPGTHTIEYQSPIDLIEIKHLAHSREGFATGAVLAAEWLKDKKGIFGMDDMLAV
jgi:4-hydroxy-tetrahydrodipicolinate reductase